MQTDISRSVNNEGYPKARQEGDERQEEVRVIEKKVVILCGFIIRFLLSEKLSTSNVK